jgi:hypothetical protein
MTKRKLRIGMAVLATALPQLIYAQGSGGEIQSLQSVLDTLYEEMIPLCSQLIDVGRGLSGFAALWYISSRVWKHIANAEPVDFYPLLRPFVLGFAIMIFPICAGVDQWRYETHYFWHSLDG